MRTMHARRNLPSAKGEAQPAQVPWFVRAELTIRREAEPRVPGSASIVPCALAEASGLRMTYCFKPGA